MQLTVSSVVIAGPADERFGKIHVPAPECGSGRGILHRDRHTGIQHHLAGAHDRFIAGQSFFDHKHIALPLAGGDVLLGDDVVFTDDVHERSLLTDLESFAGNELRGFEHHEDESNIDKLPRPQNAVLIGDGRARA